LLRWDDPMLDRVQTSPLITLAEVTGLILPTGYSSLAYRKALPVRKLKSD
jgi:EAL domain-containing protein (putative c-di-GMP-specific phosphodiesterase class I)